MVSAIDCHFFYRKLDPLYSALDVLEEENKHGRLITIDTFNTAVQVRLVRYDIIGYLQNVSKFLFWTCRLHAAFKLIRYEIQQFQHFNNI